MTRRRAKAWGLLGIAAALTAVAVAAPVREARADVQKSERVLVVVAELDSGGFPELRQLYTALEVVTRDLSRTVLGPHYRQVTVLRNRDASIYHVRHTLQTLSKDPAIHAIDMIVALHGRSNRLAFHDDRYSMNQVREILLGYTASMGREDVARMKRKLRVLYSLACYGSSHRDEWRDIGFDVVAGAVGVNANSEVEFPSVLAGWAANMGFQNAFAATNNDAAIATTDTPIRTAGQALDNELKHTNSKKRFTGRLALKITSEPQ